MLSVPELVYLASFNAWVTLRENRRHFALTQRETTESACGLVQGLCGWHGQNHGLRRSEVK